MKNPICVNQKSSLMQNAVSACEKNMQADIRASCNINAAVLFLGERGWMNQQAQAWQDSKMLGLIAAMWVIQHLQVTHLQF